MLSLSDIKNASMLAFVESKARFATRARAGGFRTTLNCVVRQDMRAFRRQRKKTAKKEPEKPCSVHVRPKKTVSRVENVHFMGRHAYLVARLRIFSRTSTSRCRPRSIDSSKQQLPGEYPVYSFTTLFSRSALSLSDIKNASMLAFLEFGARFATRARAGGFRTALNCVVRQDMRAFRRQRKKTAKKEPEKLCSVHVRPKETVSRVENVHFMGRHAYLVARLRISCRTCTRNAGQEASILRSNNCQGNILFRPFTILFSRSTLSPSDIKNASMLAFLRTYGHASASRHCLCNASNYVVASRSEVELAIFEYA